MKIKEITLNEFYNFVSSNPLHSHYQTMNYALLMSEHGYNHEFIGLIDDSGCIHAASMILLKKIKFRSKYAYAPKGFILDYFDKELVQTFTKAVRLYYKRRGVAFIKINPEIAISEINYFTKEKSYNWNTDIITNLEDAGYMKLKDNMYFESLFPRFNAFIQLDDFDIKKISKNTRNKIYRSISKGLNFEIAERSGIDILQKFIEKKKDCDNFYYKDYYNVYHKDDLIDLFLISIDAQQYLINVRSLYEKELEINNNLNNELIVSNNPKTINKKMMSDKKLLAYKNDISLATNLSKANEKIYIAGALVVKYANRVQVLISGYDKKYKSFNPNYFLHYSIINYYKNTYKYLDLNGMTGDLEVDNPYYGLNQFKIGFKPKLYEFIGEFDLPVNILKYNKYLRNGTLSKLFNKTNLKKVTK